MPRALEISVLQQAECMQHCVQIVKAQEYVRRPDKLGLGATPAAMLPKPKKYIKQVG